VLPRPARLQVGRPAAAAQMLEERVPLEDVAGIAAVDAITQFMLASK
jgi:hypothetical protein